MNQYVGYTRFLSNLKQTLPNASYTIYEVTFELFCDKQVVENAGEKSNKTETSDFGALLNAQKAQTPLNIQTFFREKSEQC